MIIDLAFPPFSVRDLYRTRSIKPLKARKELVLHDPLPNTADGVL